MVYIRDRVLAMSNTQEMKEIITSVIRGFEEEAYLNFVKGGMEKEEAFNQAINSTWILPDETTVELESDDERLLASAQS